MIKPMVKKKRPAPPWMGGPSGALGPAQVDPGAAGPMGPGAAAAPPQPFPVKVKKVVKKAPMRHTGVQRGAF